MPKVILNVPTLHHPLVGLVASMRKLTEVFTVVDWHPRQKPIYDVLEEVRPDLLFANSDVIGNVGEALKEYGTKLILAGKTIPHDLEPILTCVPTGTTEILKRNLGSPYLELEVAANTAVFEPGVFNTLKAVDLLYLSTREVVEDELDIIGGFCSSPIKYRIVGTFRPYINYVGHVSATEAADFITSAKVTIDIGQQTLYDVAMQHGFAISNSINELYPYIEKYEYDSWIGCVEKYLKDSQEKRRMIAKAHKIVKNEHTYYHRLINVLEAIEWTTEAEYVKKVTYV